jgi:hypothetical protein
MNNKRRNGMKNVIRVLALLVFVIFWGCSSDFSTTPNQNPVLEKFTGPTQCGKTEAAIFQAQGYDPDGKTVSFHFGYWLTTDTDPFPSYRDLGFTPYVANGFGVTKSIVFYEAEDYTVCCHCIDEKNLESAHIQWQIRVTD